MMGVPTFVAKVEMVTCADYCRKNVQPLGAAKMRCRGFNYLNHDSPTCEFFDESAKVHTHTHMR
jgi:hypothetical protein